MGRESSTSSRVTGFRNWARGFMDAFRLFFTEIIASWSRVIPRSSMYRRARMA